MNYVIKEVGPEDNEALLRLTHAVSTGSEAFTVDRSPSFFSLGKEFGQTTHVGLFRREELIGCIAISKQKRVINGSKQDVYYLHDLRILPRYMGSMAFYRLLTYVMERYQQETKWVFSTVLDSNPFAKLFYKQRELLPPVQKIGEMVHIGIPMFMKIRGDSSGIMRITADEAWETYSLLAPKKNFAPVDEAIFHLKNGYFLGKRENKGIVALCKVIDQSQARKLRAAKRLSVLYRLINLGCALKGCPPLPQAGEVFQHGFLSYYVSKANRDTRWDFLAYLSKHAYTSFTYIFMGLAAHEAASLGKNPLHIKLSSSVYAYGEVPAQLTVDVQELTLI